jgi:hypothetical protein
MSIWKKLKNKIMANLLKLTRFVTYNFSKYRKKVLACSKYMRFSLINFLKTINKNDILHPK